MLSTYATILSALACFACAQTGGPANIPAMPTDVSPEVASKIVSDQEAYISSATAQPQFTAAALALASAIPASLQDDFVADPTGFFQDIFTAQSLPPWFSAVPSSDAAYFSNLGNGLASVVTKDMSMTGAAASPTGGSASPSDAAATAASTAEAQSANAAVQGSPVVGAGILGAVGIAAVAML